MADVWCNGEFLDERRAVLSVSDRGFTLADGIFETLLVIDGNPLWFEDHMLRMRSAAAQLGLHIAFRDDEIKAAVSSLSQKENLATAAARITLTRGPTSKRGLWVSDNPGHPTLLVTCAPSVKPLPQRVVICQITRRNEYSPLSQVKSLNYGDNILARREAIARDATDALMLNTKGNIVCSTVGNVFFNVGGDWLTPPMSEGVLPGLARKRLISALAANEQRLPLDIIRDVDVAFISNSLGCSPIVDIEGHMFCSAADERVLASIYC